MRSAGSRSRTKAHGAALLAIVLWGLSFVATKTVLGEIRPVTLIFSRFAIGTAILVVPLALRRAGGGGPPLDKRALAWMGFFGIFVHQMVQVFGLQWTTATNTGWLIGLTPIWAAVLGALFLGERLGRGRSLGLGLGLAGALLVVAGHTSGGWLPSFATGRGDLLVIVSTLNWAAYTVYGRRLLRAGGGLRATVFSMGVGAALLAVPFVATAGWRDWPALSATGWASLLFLGVGCSGIAYLCWSFALERLEASRVAAWLYLEPFVTQVAAAALLNEPVTGTVIAGGLVVLAGVWLVQRRG